MERRRRLTRKAKNLFQYRYIHVPHGMTIEDQERPHTHLWDRLIYEDLNVSDRFIEAFYHLYILPNPEWYDHFWKMVDGTGKIIQFHCHGTINGKFEDLNRIIYRYFITIERPKLINRISFIKRILVIDICLFLLLF